MIGRRVLPWLQLTHAAHGTKTEVPSVETQRPKAPISTSVRLPQHPKASSSPMHVWSVSCATALVAVVSLGSSSSATVNAHRDVPRHPPRQVTQHTVTKPACPWAESSVNARSTPESLAREVLVRMTLVEKAAFVVLSAKDGYQNKNSGVPRLCIPAITLQDGPNGIAYGDKGVSQLPSSLGIAASFDPSLAYQYGKVLGNEARGKGIDVVQGPNLNLLRVPESGRAFEGYGEDPYLVSQMGDADIEGIQSNRVMAEAKHFTAYNQETARLLLNQHVGERALEELYLAPFETAVNEAHVASVMCAYGSLNGVDDCATTSLYKKLYGIWKSPAFVRSDLDSVRSIPAAINAGMSMVKPVKPSTIVSLVAGHQLSIRALNNAVRRVLTQMFRFRLVDHPRPETPNKIVTTAQHANFALHAAESSMVLLRNSGLLPLPRRISSIAVIGVDAGAHPSSAGHGSAWVEPPFVSSPLSAIKRFVSSRTKINYAPGGPEVFPLSEIPLSAYASGKPLPLSPSMLNSKNRNRGVTDLGIISHSGATPEVQTADHPQTGPYPWSVWRAVIVPPRTGLYDLSLTQNGDTWLSIDGHQVISYRGLHGHSTSIVAKHLIAGHHYRFELDWFQTGPTVPQLRWRDVSPAIDRAVRAARKSHIAVVFVNDYNSEGVDRTNLSLPGDSDELIKAVERANSRTVVVLNTGGAVLMPWLSGSSAVLEAWYPGEEDGRATAKVLFGTVNPSGRLPVTFPPSNSDVPTANSGQWPGTKGTATYSEGLDIGYRWFQTNAVTPLFPFGFGLSYTSFRLGSLHLQPTSSRDNISLSVTNTGGRSGIDVVECFLSYPPDDGEPPFQLRAFSRVELTPGETKIVTLSLKRSSFESFQTGRFLVPAGKFTAWVGSSSSDLTESIPAVAPSS